MDAIAAAMPNASSATHQALALRARYSYAAAGLLTENGTVQDLIVPRNLSNVTQPMRYRYYVNVNVARRGLRGELHSYQGRFYRNIAIDSDTQMTREQLQEAAALALQDVINSGDDYERATDPNWEARNVQVDIYAVTRQ